jgi:hypothetical protein
MDTTPKQIFRTGDTGRSPTAICGSKIHPPPFTIGTSFCPLTNLSLQENSTTSCDSLILPMPSNYLSVTMPLPMFYLARAAQYFFTSAAALFP